jgi:hypothetical protein
MKKIILHYCLFVLLSLFLACRKCEVCKRTTTKTLAGKEPETATEIFTLCGKDLKDEDNQSGFARFPGGDSSVVTKCKKRWN